MHTGRWVLAAVAGMVLLVSVVLVAQGHAASWWTVAGVSWLSGGSS